jgi:hypothetical protein
VAAKNLGLEQKYIEEVEFWNGTDEFPEVEFDDEPPKTKKRSREGMKKKSKVEQKPTGQANPEDEPNDAIQNFYKLTEPFLEGLLMDDADLKGLAALASMNEKIKVQNQKDGVSPVDQWTINTLDLLKHYSAAKPFYIRYLDNEHDEEALHQLQNARAEMAGSLYPDTFLYPIIPNSLTRKAEAEKEKAEKEKAEKEKAEKEKTANANKQKGGKGKVEVKGAYTSEAPGMIEYPWTTHVLPDGRVIIAGRRHMRRGKVGNSSTLLVASDEGEDPTFNEVSGASIGAEEVDIYFNLPNIKLLAEKRENGEKARTWTWRDKDHFVRLLWVSVGSIKMAEFGKGSKSGQTKCCVEMDNGIDICARNDLKQAIEGAPADGHINAYCKRKGLTKPGDVIAENIKVPKDKRILAAQTWLAEEGLGNFATAAPSTGKSTSGWTAVNSSTGNSDLQSTLLRMEKRMASMEKKVDGLSPVMKYMMSVLDRVMEETGVDVDDIPLPSVSR